MASPTWLFTEQVARPATKRFHPPVRLESSGGVLSTVDMVVQRRDGPRRLRDHDDADDDVCMCYCSVDQGLLEEATVKLCRSFVVNNSLTGNLASLVRVFLIRAGELKVSAQCHE